MSIISINHSDTAWRTLIIIEEQIHASDVQNYLGQGGTIIIPPQSSFLMGQANSVFTGV